MGAKCWDNDLKLVPFHLFGFGVTPRPPPEALSPSGPALASVTVCWLQLMQIGVGGASRIGGVLLTFGLMPGPYFQALKSKSTFCFCFGRLLSRLVDLCCDGFTPTETLCFCECVGVLSLSYMSSLTWILGLFRSLSHFCDTRQNKALLAALLTLRCPFCI